MELNYSSLWQRLGLGFVPNEQSFFRRTNRTIKNDPIVPKNIGTSIKEQIWNKQHLLEKNVKVRNAFLLSRTRSISGTHFKT